MSDDDAVTFGDPRLPDEYWRCVEIRGECWIWTGMLQNRIPCFHTHDDSGRLHYHGAKQFTNALRTVEIATYPEIIDSLGSRTKIALDCGNDECVNPAHFVQFVKPTAARSHCGKGHEMTDANTITSLSRPGAKTCKRCWTISSTASHLFRLCPEDRELVLAHVAKRDTEKASAV